VDLILRTYNVSDGTLFLDGKDVNSLPIARVRQSCAYVPQDNFLFSDTIENNITFGQGSISHDTVENAAKLSDVHDNVTDFPLGYHTMLGERGVTVSGGQKQRISIARVFLKNPPILILDEATSALDNESERLVQQSLEKLAKGRTTFTIAHRLTTIKNADRILVLTEKGIEESGSHEELLQKGGLYSELYKLYAEL
jgi:ATP-binding cassette subfamily B protein